MNYNTMTLQLTDPLSFWRHFDGRERVFWYDTQKQRLIIGADRRAVLQTEADSKAYPYIFYGRTFFDTARGDLWRDMGNEMIAFSHYYIADADGERYMYADVPEKGQAEVDSFNLADGIIGHNAKMNDFLRQNGVKVPLVDLGIFDYDNPQPIQPYHGYDKSVCYAGNLIDAVFLDNVHPTNRFDLFGPNPAEHYNDGLNYRGQFSPTELPSHMDENFGLVWHGTSVDTCDGTFGRYLKWNNPHKTSLYLSSGLPVIIWDQAALADFVIENGVGITISSLNELNEKLDAITDEEYRQMHQNVEKIANQMRSGYYITHAMQKMLATSED